jgi:hypothetical protein
VNDGASGGRTATPAHRRRLAIGTGVLVVVIALIVASVIVGDDRGPGSGPSPAPGAGAPSSTVAIAVTGAPHAMLAVVGTGGDRAPAAIVLPPGTTIVAPGQGETTTEGIGMLPGDSLRVAMANAIGAWIPHYAVVEIDGLAAAVDRAGGLSVDLADVVTTDAGVLGPGTTGLDGAEFEALLAAEGDETGERWASILEAILADPTSIQSGDLRETDDAEQALGTLTDATGAVVELAPVAPVAASATVLLQPEFDELVGERLGVSEPVRVLVQNGNGRPGIGEEVARRLLPNGFRVVISQNADNFRHRITEIAATEEGFADEAERAREALGVGEVAVSQVPSGLADITIVVGRDFRV